MHTATADPLLGRTLEGRYRILDRIARGGMSVVYSAVDERLDRLVAVKVMSGALSADPAFSDRFTREARAAARLTHLNAVSVYDQGSDSSDGTTHVFLVMELVKGRTLRDLIRETGPVPTASAVSIMEPVLSALAAAHRAGLVHRDVKPENILLSDDGIVKVADFGLARAVEADTSTRTGLMMGTVAYCAPEQISRGAADQRSDVYSAGIVLFELLTGQPPFRGDSAMNIAYQHVHSRVPAPSSRIRGIPSEIDELVIDATDSDPTCRPIDAADFLARLADVRSSLALPVVPVPARTLPATAASARRSDGARASVPGAVTDVLAAASQLGRNDTFVVPRRESERDRAGRQDVGRRDTAPQRGALPPDDRHAPPPPVVTPPPRRRRQVSPRTRRRRRTFLVLIVILLLALAAGYGGWWFAAGRFGTIPNVTNDPQSVAISDLRHAGYQVSARIEDQYSETIPAGLVVSTDPRIGAREPHGHTITLIVSKGQERFRVPAVANMSLAQAQAALATIPVQVAPSQTQQASDTVAAGNVIGTNPAAGAQVKRDASISIIVSSGLPIVTIPPVSAGTPADQAEATLTGQGFRISESKQFSTDVPAGAVISTTPTGTARKGSVITVVVSKGPQIVTVPDISVGMPVADAETALTQAGLKYQVHSFAGSANSVLAITPGAGTPVQAGSTVVIYAI